MAKPTRPIDAFVTNGWYMNIPFPGIMNDAHFETLGGVNKNTGTVEVIDAGTNHKIRFGDQIIDFGELTLTRTYDGSTADVALEELVDLCQTTGFKFPCQAVKMHWGNEVFRINFTGFRFTSIQHPDQNVAGQEKYTVSYGATCDDFDIVRF